MDYILKEIKRKLIYFFSCLGPGGTLRLVAAVALVSALIMELRGEIGGEIGVKRNDLGDVAVYLLDESHVLDHVVWDSRLVILVHLLDQNSVPVQHGLNLSEIMVQAVPNLGIPALLGGGFGQVLVAVVVVVGGGVGHGGLGGCCRGGGAVIGCGHVQLVLLLDIFLVSDFWDFEVGFC